MTESAQGVVLGVDGGGTKTIAILADGSGQVLGWGRAGNCDIYSNTDAVGELEKAVVAALAMAELDRSAIECGVFSLVGADWPEDFVLWREALTRLGFGKRVEVVNDAIGALASSTVDTNAVIVVCGTGAAIGSRNVATGEMWHSSFWQLTQGGGEISANALNAVYRAHLGIAPPTTLTIPILGHLGASTVDELLHRFTCREHKAARKPSDLVPLVFHEAERGDLVARQILISHGSELAKYVKVAARRVGIDTLPFELVLAGGVLRSSSSLLRDALLEGVTQSSAGFTLARELHEPARGAVMLALGLTSVDGSEKTSERLDASFPPTRFFHTGMDANPAT